MEMLRRIKPLLWKRTSEIWWVADVPNGKYDVFKRSESAWAWRFTGKPAIQCRSFEAGRAACERHWMQMLEKISEPVDIEWEYRRHVEELRKLVGQRSGEGR